jgi:alcohol dehydrogenase
MKAAQFSAYGDPSVVEINEVPKPQAGPGQVLVEVHAASLNPFDTSVRSGYMKEMIPLKLPVTLGGDIAGVVAATADGVSGIDVGDKVYGTAAVVSGGSGAFAEYAVAKVGGIALAPDNVDFKTAAALPLVGVSALQALAKHINLQPGQKILIHGGAGGIGQIAVQLAKHLGAYVATTVATPDAAYAKDLGADLVIDYTKQKFEDEVSGYDAVFDTVGGDTFERSLGVLTRGGIAVSMIMRAGEAQVKELGITAIHQQTRVTTAALGELRAVVEAGTLKVRIDSVFPLDQAREAFAKRESGTAHGKVVLEI